MIAVDTSALFAIVMREAEADTFLDHILGAARAIVGAPTAFELRLVVWRKFGATVLPRIETLLQTPPIEIVAWTPELMPVAEEALVRFGGRPARLNFGDCMAYAVAKAAGCPLLYKGSDFDHTDIAPLR